MIEALLTLLLLADAAPALAPASDTPSANSKESDQNRIVCERYEETGSRLASRRICKTVREWQEQRSGQRADVERSQQQNTGIPSSN